MILLNWFINCKKFRTLLVFLNRWCLLTLFLNYMFLSNFQLTLHNNLLWLLSWVNFFFLNKFLRFFFFFLQRPRIPSAHSPWWQTSFLFLIKIDAFYLIITLTVFTCFEKPWLCQGNLVFCLVWEVNLRFEWVIATRSCLFDSIKVVNTISWRRWIISIKIFIFWKLKLFSSVQRRVWS